MYKNILTILSIALAIHMNAQDLPKNDVGKYEYSEVVNVEGATKEQLFRTSRAWFIDNFGKKAQGDDVIQVDDSYLGEMTATPLLWIEVRSMGKNQSGGAISYNIMVSSKDGKYKYTIGSFYHEANRSTVGSGGALENDSPDCGEQHMKAQTWMEIKSDTEMKVQKMIADLKAKMMTSTSNEDGNW